MNKPHKRTVVSGVIIFILLPLLIALLMYFRMQTVVQAYLEKEVSSQAETLKQLFSLRLSNRLEELERIAGYFRDGRVAEEKMGTSAQRLLANSSQTSVGIVRLDGSAVSGKALQPSEFPAVRNTFRGKSTVRYRRGEGLLFTAPIYNNGNIKYAIYEFFDEDTLFKGLESVCFKGKAAIMLADSEQQIIVPIVGDMTEEDPFFKRAEVVEALAALGKMLNVNPAAAVYCKADGQEYYPFVSEMEQANLYLVGIVPGKVVSEDLDTISQLVLLVFALLLVLLTIGTYRVVSADARARESDELRAAKRAAEEASESKGKFLANMSHELRTPINTVLGMNEMVLRETREDETRERAMDVKSAAQILLGLINDVLDFSKIESGMLTILPVEYSLVALIRDLALLSENRARSKSLDFEMDIQQSLPVGLYGDDIRIRQVLTNLLTNAVKYTKTGTVMLRMSGTRTSGSTLVLHCEVADTGVGIKPEEIENLKLPYTRVNDATNRKEEGTGLGLPIIVNLLKLMDSELQIESVYGEGSRFFFDLEQRVVEDEPIGDIWERLESEAKDYEYRVTCYAPTAKVLLVDDNSMNRKIFVNLLKQTKIQVTAVSSGQKCLDMVQKEQYDIIFMDHLMPEMDGLETLKRLKQLDNNLCKAAPVVALTANAFSGAQEMYKSAGFDAFMAKPISAEKLEGLLVEMLPKERLEEPPKDSGPEGPSTAPSHGSLPEIDGVNWDYALLHIQDSGLLMDTMRDFYRTIGGECRELDRLLGRLDADDGLSGYRTRVHALKSTSGMVGILTVSGLARVLEEAAWTGDADKIRSLHPALLEELEKTEGRLRPFMAQGPGEALSDGTHLAELLDMLRGALDGMDIAASDRVMDEITRYSYEPPLQSQVDQLRDLVSRLDFDGAEEAISRLLEHL